MLSMPYGAALIVAVVVIVVGIAIGVLWGLAYRWARPERKNSFVETADSNMGSPEWQRVHNHKDDLDWHR